MNLPAVRPDAGRAIWHHHAGKVLAIGVWSERRPERGEDAEPLLIHHGPGNNGVLGVFDGAGGSGAAMAYRSKTAEPRTGAWVASRLARTAVESWFCTTAADSGETLRERLGKALGELQPETTSRLTGTMRRALPTTMAVLRYKIKGKQVRCGAYWAGDSRAYLLSPHTGLHVLTRDHTDEPDALEQLRQDPPMNNVICASHDFRVDVHKMRFSLPAVLLCATDGFFGYVSTPPQFESRLLCALRDARDEADWADLLSSWATRHSGDDASLSAIALGFDGFNKLQTAFTPRTSMMIERYPPGPPLDDRADHERWRLSAWQRYRIGYESRMPPTSKAEE